MQKLDSGLLETKMFESPPTTTTTQMDQDLAFHALKGTVSR